MYLNRDGVPCAGSALKETNQRDMPLVSNAPEKEGDLIVSNSPEREGNPMLWRACF